MKRLVILAVAITIASSTYAQVGPKISVNAYIESYYSYDYNKPADHSRPGFVYSHNRHNEVNLNLAFIKGNYYNGTVRANLAVMSGTYANANLLAEPGVLKNIFEANVGIKLSGNSNLWLDAGIFASHIGFESAVSKDCWSLTRSILADNSPYYESGAKLTYTSNGVKWLFSGLFLNGWQHIQRPNGNNTPAYGTQITFTPSSKITLNYSTFIGSDKPDVAKQLRYFHNFYGVFHFTDNFHLIAGFDYGKEQKLKNSRNYNNWYSPVIIVKVNFDDKWDAAGRWEYYSDEHGVIIATGTQNGFKTIGYSLNLDYAPVSNAVIRLEGKVYNSKDPIFIRDSKPLDYNAGLTGSIAVAF